MCPSQIQIQQLTRVSPVTFESHIIGSKPIATNYLKGENPDSVNATDKFLMKKIAITRCPTRELRPLSYSPHSHVCDYTKLNNVVIVKPMIQSQRKRVLSSTMKIAFTARCFYVNDDNTNIDKENASKVHYCIKTKILRNLSCIKSAWIQTNSQTVRTTICRPKNICLMREFNPQHAANRNYKCTNRTVF